MMGVTYCDLERREKELQELLQDEKGKRELGDFCETPREARLRNELYRVSMRLIDMDNACIRRRLKELSEARG